MLFLVGIGLSEKDISLKAIETCRACSTVYVERYTSFVSDPRIGFLEETIGMEIKSLNRSGLEEDASTIAAEAVSQDVAIMVGGDPLIATTHKILFLEAVKRGIRPTIVHSSSAVSAAIGESGLDFYRFGQVCTIPQWSAHYEPVSFYETIARNASSNQHSLLLLDYDHAKQKSMDLSEALRILEAAEKRYGKGIVNDDMEIILLHRISLEGQRVELTSLKNARYAELAAGPTILILPSKLSDIEREVLEAMHKRRNS